MKTDLSDLTFIIPLRIDSIIRIENLLIVTDFLTTHFKCNVFILETGAYNIGILRSLLNKRIKYQFIEDRDPVFHRTKYLNIMSDQISTPYIAIWDADVIVDPKQIISSVENLRLNKAQIAYPYDGRFFDTSMLVRELFLQTRDLELLNKHRNKMKLLYIDGSVGEALGGAFIVNSEAYRSSGMENEKFYGWGPEDSERYQRWKSLKYKIYRNKGCLFHLSHPKDLNGTIHKRIQIDWMINQVKIRRLSSSNEIIKEIKMKDDYKK